MGLAIGMWVHDELTYNTNFENYDRFGQLHLHQTFNDDVTTSMAISLPCAPALRNEFGADIEKLSLSSWQFQHFIVSENHRFLKNGNYVEPTFPEMFSLNMIPGNRTESLADPKSIIISLSLAEALFGRENPMGKTVRFDATFDMEVIGVFEDFPFNSNMRRAQFFTTWALFLEENEWARNSHDNWGNHSFQMFVQLKEHADFCGSFSKIKDIEIKHNESGDPQYFIHPMADWHLYFGFRNGKNVYAKLSPASPFDYEFIDQEYSEKFIAEERVGNLARVFAFLAIFISCLGLFGLSAFVAEQGTKEIGIRKFLGASVTNLWALQSKRFVTLVVLSCFIAIPVAWYYLDGWLADYDYRISLGWGVFLLSGILALVVTLATVCFQSLKAALANPINSLRSE